MQSNVPDFSFEEQGAAPAAPDALDRLNKKIEEAIELKEAIDQMEEDLAATKQALNNLNTVVLPDMMAELGVDDITQRGWSVKVGEFVSGSLPKDEDKKQKAIAWLKKQGAEDLLKTNIKVEFSRSQHEEAVKLARRIEKAGFAPNVESSVHPQTLCAWARERIKGGEPLDTDVLGLYTGRVAKFTKVKAKAKRS